MTKKHIIEHTPGPWKCVSVQGGWDSVGSDQGEICKLSLNNPANGRLIAAVPDLLEACKDAFADLKPYEWIDLPDGYAVLGTVKKLRAAIAKAKGGNGNDKESNYTKA